MSDRVGRVVLGLAVGYALVLSSITILKLVGFTAEHDLGIYAQYLWLLGNLHNPFSTIALRSMLDDHFEPTFALLAPLGSVGIQAVGLLVVQAVSIAIVAPLLYALALRHGASGWLAAVPSALWLVSPVVIKVNLFDYHPDTLLPALLVGAVLALETRREWLFVVLVVLATGVKEDAGLTVAALGIAVAWTGRKRLGVTVAVASTAWSVVVMFIVMPHRSAVVRDSFAKLFAGSRGNSLGDVLVYSVRHPLDTVGSTLHARQARDPRSRSSRLPVACASWPRAGCWSPSRSPRSICCRHTTRRARSSTTTGSFPWQVLRSQGR